MVQIDPPSHYEWMKIIENYRQNTNGPGAGAAGERERGESKKQQNTCCLMQDQLVRHRDRDKYALILLFSPSLFLI